MEGEEGKKWTLSLMVRPRGEGYDVACPGNLPKNLYALLRTGSAYFGEVL